MIAALWSPCLKSVSFIFSKQASKTLSQANTVIILINKNKHNCSGTSDVFNDNSDDKALLSLFSVILQKNTSLQPLFAWLRRWQVIALYYIDIRQILLHYIDIRQFWRNENGECRPLNRLAIRTITKEKQVILLSLTIILSLH